MLRGLAKKLKDRKWRGMSERRKRSRDGDRKRRERSPTVVSSSGRRQKRPRTSAEASTAASSTAASDPRCQELLSQIQQFSAQIKHPFRPRMPRHRDAGEIVGFYGDKTKYTIKFLNPTHEDPSYPVEVLIQIHVREGETENPRKEEQEQEQEQEQSAVAQGVHNLINCIQAQKLNELPIPIPENPSKNRTLIRRCIRCIAAQKQLWLQIPVDSGDQQQSALQSLIQCLESQKQLLFHILEKPSSNHILEKPSKEQSSLQSLVQCLETPKQPQNPSKDQPLLQSLIQCIGTEKLLWFQILEKPGNYPSTRLLQSLKQCLESQNQLLCQILETPSKEQSWLQYLIQYFEGRKQIQYFEGQKQVPEHDQVQIEETENPRKDKSGDGGKGETQDGEDDDDSDSDDDIDFDIDIDSDSDSDSDDDDYEEEEVFIDLRYHPVLLALYGQAEAVRDSDCEACDGPHYTHHCAYFQSLPPGAKYNTRKYEVVCWWVRCVNPPMHPALPDAVNYLVDVFFPRTADW